MKLNIFAGVATLAIIGATPLAAQSYNNGYNNGNNGYNNSYNNGANGWNRDTFWRGAPTNPRDRIPFLQQRINRGMADGSLSRREGRNAQRELDSIRRDAKRGSWNSQRSAMTQQRLDNLSQRLRWQRQNARNGYNGSANAGGYYAGNDPRFQTNYDASRYYREGPNYSERRLTAEDEVYRGSDGRYYCKRNDGTTGLIAGAAGGGILGNLLDGGHNRAAGTLIGGALGALAGKAIEQNNDVRCR